jgi:hypothetical protein
MLLALPVTAFAGDEFSSFRIPANSYLDWRGGASTSGAWQNSSVGPDHSSSSYFSGSGSSSFASWREDDARVSQWTGGFSAGGTRRHDESLDHFLDYLDSGLTSTATSGGSRSMQESAGLSTSQSWYAASAPIGLIGSISGQWADDQYWSSARRLRQNSLAPLDPVEQLSSRVFKRYSSGMSAGAGWILGRVRNATGVFEARVLEARLLRLGALNRPLSAQGRQRLADLMYAHRDVGVGTARPAAPVMDAVERILYEDGALRDSVLTASDLFHLTESIFDRYLGGNSIGPDGLPRSPIARASGAFISVQLFTTHSRTAARQDLTQTTIPYTAGTPGTPVEQRQTGSSKQTSDGTQLHLAAEWHHPSSMRSQWDATSGFDKILSGSDRGFAFFNQLGWTYIAADRWLIGAGASQQRKSQRTKEHVTLADDWGTSVSVGIQYLVIDRVSIGFGASQAWNKSRNDLYFASALDPRAAAWFNGGSFNLAMSYRFAGSSHIAGVYPAMMGN